MKSIIKPSEAGSEQPESARNMTSHEPRSQQIDKTLSRAARLARYTKRGASLG
jgi:hypothetical protein